MNCPQCQHPLRENARFCDNCGLSVGTLNAATERAQDSGAPPDPLIGHTLEGKYQLIERLGKGGMGVVYRARRVLIGDEVALKILRGELVAEAEAVGRFRREARAAAMLRHPNVVLIYDYGEARGQDAPAYIVMELVRGEPLRDLLEREGKLETERAVRLMREICAGVGAAHRRSIVHRDIKPDNIIVLPPDEDEDRERESVKVVDFGIAKLRDPSGGGTLTQKGFQPGTVYYMSPEQCRGDDLDVRSDVYSLGALFYEMLAGAPPFMAETRTGVISKHLFDPPRSFAEDLSIPPALEAVIMRALAKDPEARQTDAAMLSRELLEAERQEHKRREAERQNQEAKTLRLEKSAEEEERKRAAEEERRLREARTVPSDDSVKRREERADARLPRTQPAPTQPSPAKATAEQPTPPQPTQKLDFPIPVNKAPTTDPISIEGLGLAQPAPERKRGGIIVLAGLGVVILAALVVAAILFMRGGNSNSPSATRNAPASATTNAPTPNMTSATAKPNFTQFASVPTSLDRFKVAVSPDGKQFVSTGETARVGLWRINESGAPSLVSGFNGAGRSVAISPNNEMVAVGGDDGEIKILRATDATLIRAIPSNRDYIFLVGFTPDGRNLFAAGADRKVRLWNAETWSAGETLNVSPDELIATVSADGQTSAVYNETRKSVKLVSIDGSRTVELQDHAYAISAGAFSPVGGSLALGSMDGAVRLWMVSDGFLIRTLTGARGEVGSVAFSADGNLLAIGWANGDIELRRTSDGEPLQTLKGHTKIARTLSFSRNGRVLASGAEDRTIRLWRE